MNDFAYGERNVREAVRLQVRQPRIDRELQKAADVFGRNNERKTTAGGPVSDSGRRCTILASLRALRMLRRRGLWQRRSCMTRF